MYKLCGYLFVSVFLLFGCSNEGSSGKNEVVAYEKAQKEAEIANDEDRLKKIEEFKESYAERELIHDDGTPIVSKEDKDVLDYIDAISQRAIIFEKEYSSAEYLVGQAEENNEQLFLGSNGIGMVEDEIEYVSQYKKDLKGIKPHKDFKEYHENVIKLADAHMEASEAVLKAYKKKDKDGLLKARKHFDEIKTLRDELEVTVSGALEERSINYRTVWAFPS